MKESFDFLKRYLHNDTIKVIKSLGGIFNNEAVSKIIFEQPLLLYRGQRLSTFNQAIFKSSFAG